MLINSRKFQIPWKSDFDCSWFCHTQGVVWYLCLEDVLLLQLAKRVSPPRGQGTHLAGALPAAPTEQEQVGSMPVGMHLQVSFHARKAGDGLLWESLVSHPST